MKLRGAFETHSGGTGTGWWDGGRDRSSHLIQLLYFAPSFILSVLSHLNFLPPVSPLRQFQTLKCIPFFVHLERQENRFVIDVTDVSENTKV